MASKQAPSKRMVTPSERLQEDAFILLYQNKPDEERETWNEMVTAYKEGGGQTNPTQEIFKKRWSLNLNKNKVVGGLGSRDRAEELIREAGGIDQFLVALSQNDVLSVADKVLERNKIAENSERIDYTAFWKPQEDRILLDSHQARHQGTQNGEIQDEHEAAAGDSKEIDEYTAGEEGGEENEPKAAAEYSSEDKSEVAGEQDSEKTDSGGGLLESLEAIARHVIEREDQVEEFQKRIKSLEDELAAKERELRTKEEELEKARSILDAARSALGSY